MAFQLPLDPALLIRLEVRDSNLASASPGERLRRGIGPAAFDHIKGRLGHAAVKVIGATQAFVITFLYQVLMGHEPNTENMQSAVRRMALQACGENLQHHNTATLESVFTDLLHTPLDRTTLQTMHSHLSIQAKYLKSVIADFSAPAHFALFASWCTTAALHLFVLEDLVSCDAQQTFYGLWQTYKEQYDLDFRFLAEGFLRKRVFAIIGVYSHAHSKRPCYDALGRRDGEDTVLHHISDQLKYDSFKRRGASTSGATEGEHEQSWTTCRRWLRDQLVDLLLCPTQFFLNIPPQDHATARALLVGFLPDSEIADMVGPYQGHWTVTARDVPLVIRKQTLPQVRQSLSTGRYKGTLIASL